MNSSVFNAGRSSLLVNIAYSDEDRIAVRNLATSRRSLDGRPIRRLMQKAFRE